MNTTTTSSTAAQNTEVTLGWKSMPAYGEVMPTLIGTAHTNVESTLKLTKKSVLSSFWTAISNVK